MKKLLVTAIGAAAAFGAVADTISTQRFESVTGDLPKAQAISDLNTLAGGDYWSGDELTNTYTVVSALGETFPQEKPLGPATKALEIKTTFGNPLTVKAIAGDNTSTNIPASGIYFDSLVKFTVCEEEPDQTYDGAKIIMWLQEQTDGGDNILGTNIMVRANYINADGTFTPTNFTCYPFTGSIDKWYRVTIKTWADITNGSGIPGFAIFIDNDPVNVAAGATMADAFASNLTEAAGYFGKTKVFASLVQGNAAGKSSITSASFDGTGKLTDLVFTDEAPFAAAEDYVAPKAAVTIDGSPVEGIKTLAQAVAAVNGATSGETATLTLLKGMTLDEPIVFATRADKVVLNFAGCVLTNDLGVAAITNSAYLVVTNSVGNGGITGISDGSSAIYQIDDNGQLDVYGGVFRADIEGFGNGNLLIAGGSFRQEADIFTWEEPSTHEVFSLIEPGKTLEYNQETGLYDVVDYVVPTYTITVAGGEHFTVAVTTNGVAAGGAGAYVVTEGDSVAVTYTADTGYTLSKDSDSIASVSADATIAAPTATLQTFKVIFVDGELSTTNVVDYGSSSVGEVPEFAGRTGYTAAWDSDPTAVVSVTSDLTFTAVYTGKTFTIVTYTNGVENTSKEFTYAGVSVAPADPLYNTETETWDGKWYTENGGSTEFAFDAAGALTQNAYATIEGKSAPIQPIVPSEGGEQTYDDAAAATAARDAINANKAAYITPPTGVSDTTTYYSYVEAKADGTKVTVDFTTAGETAAQTSANTDVAALPVAAAAADDTTATVSTVAGFYYSIVSGATPSTVTTEGTRVLGTGGTITLPMPKVGTAGFYKVKVSATK